MEELHGEKGLIGQPLPHDKAQTHTNSMANRKHLLLTN